MEMTSKDWAAQAPGSALVYNPDPPVSLTETIRVPLRGISPCMIVWSHPPSSQWATVHNRRVSQSGSCNRTPVAVAPVSAIMSDYPPSFGACIVPEYRAGVPSIAHACLQIVALNSTILRSARSACCRRPETSDKSAARFPLSLSSILAAAGARPHLSRSGGCMASHRKPTQLALLIEGGNRLLNLSRALAHSYAVLPSCLNSLTWARSHPLNSAAFALPF